MITKSFLESWNINNVMLENSNMWISWSKYTSTDYKMFMVDSPKVVFICLKTTKDIFESFIVRMTFTLLLELSCSCRLCTLLLCPAQGWTWQQRRRRRRWGQQAASVHCLLATSLPWLAVQLSASHWPAAPAVQTHLVDPAGCCCQRLERRRRRSRTTWRLWTATHHVGWAFAQGPWEWVRLNQGVPSNRKTISESVVVQL